jgi:hypothetical protein
MPVRRLAPFGALILKVSSADALLPVAVANIHSLLVQLKGEESEWN